MLGQLRTWRAHRALFIDTSNRKGEPFMADDPSGTEMASGLAALAICESLLTSLRDLKIIGAQEVVGILKDASAAHHQATTATDTPKAHRAAAAVIDRMIVGKNSVRHS
jgi:hypothetical protein